MKILFVYPTNRHEMYQSWKKGREPSTLMYGFCEMKKQGYDVNFQDTFGTRKKIIKYLFLPFEIIFFKLVGISLHFDHVFSQIGAIKSSDLVVSVSDSSSIPLLLLKKLRLLQKQRTICFSVDLINRISEKRIVTFLKSIFQEAERVVVFSKEEKKQFEQKLYLSNVEYVRFGIDTDFFTKYAKKVESENRQYVVTVGRDRSRDYKFFMDIADLLPKQKFIVICSRKNVVNLTIPNNVQVVFDADYATIKKWLSKSFCFLLPLHELHRASGQIAFIEAIASNLPIISSPANSVKGNYDLNENEGVYFFEKDITKWKNKINEIKNHKQIFIRKETPSVKNLSDILKRSLNEHYEK